MPQEKSLCPALAVAPLSGDELHVGGEAVFPVAFFFAAEELAGKEFGFLFAAATADIDQKPLQQLFSVVASHPGYTQKMCFLNLFVGTDFHRS